MDKDSARLFGTTVVITAAIIAGAYLLDRANKTGRPLPPEQATWTELTPSSSRHPGPNSLERHPGQREARDPGSIGNPATPDPQTDVLESTIVEIARTNDYLVCQHPDPNIGTIYTNEQNCEDVNLDNRLSQAEPFQPIPNPDRYKNNDYQTPDRAAANSRSNIQPKNQKPNLRLNGKSPPKGLNVSCKNSVGKALEIERTLAATDDPRESAWRDSYCKQRCEAIEERCPVADDYFYYRFRYMCGTTEYWNCAYRAGG